MNIVKNRKLYISISIILIIIGLGTMLFNRSQGKGLFNYDIQFTGGTSIQVSIGKDFENEEIINIVTENTSESKPQVQKIGDGNSVIIKTKSLPSEERQALIKAISDKYTLEQNVFSVEDISATISSEMLKTSVIAVLVSSLAMLIYVSLRFRDIRSGLSIVLALAHDGLVLLAFYAVFRIPLNNSFIAAVLTVLGYSINASIVIFDRIRENKIKHKSWSSEDCINTSINQSLRRSAFTSLTTFFTVISLYIFGVESVKVFALPIVVGIVVGTYSSICIAGSLLYMISKEK